jgi:hypothetical protein
LYNISIWIANLIMFENAVKEVSCLL